MLASNLIMSNSGVSLDPDLVLEFNTALGDLTIELPLNGTVDATVDWGDGLFDTYTTAGTRTHTYATGGIYTVRVSGTVTWFGSFVTRPELTKCLSFGDIGLTDLSSAFNNCANLTTVPDDIPSTVTSLTAMFASATSFNQNIGNWNLSNVTAIPSMFSGATSFNQNIGNWNTSNVTNMFAVFQNATSFNQNIGGWNTSNVTQMTDMFRGATAFNQNIGSWNTSKVTEMQGLFRGATSFNQNIGNWDVTSVWNMQFLFENATSFNQNIGNWEPSSATSMFNMFNGATNFNQNLSGWCVGNISSLPNSFATNSALTSGNLPVWGTCPTYQIDGNITYVGAAEGTTSATLPAHQAGDIILAFSFRVFANVSPTLPSGWTNILDTSGNSQAIRLAYKVATSSSESSDTWTNATRVIFLVYRNVEIKGIALVEQRASATGSSTIVSYNAVGTWKDLAWTVAFMGHRSTNNSAGTPTGLTARSSTNSGARMLGADSTNTTNNWATQTVNIGGSSNGWHTVVLRLRNKIKKIGT
jgi:surface protein